MLSVLTINHNNTEISFLENFAFSKDNLHLALGGLIDKRGIDECFILSTCNRIEIYVYSKIENIINFRLKNHQLLTSLCTTKMLFIIYSKSHLAQIQ